MERKTVRKTDRRTLYTKMVIKDALLELMKERGFEQLTVTAVCEEAEVTRATFYLHFDSLTAVLDEILVEALKMAENSSANPNEDMLQMLHLITNGERDPEKLQKHDTLLPVCQRVADLPKYRVLFLDESLSSYIIKKMFQAEKEKMIPLLMQYCNLPKKEAEMLFFFVMYGSFSINKMLGWKKDRNWYEIQGTLIRFILGGMDALR
ncbi:tetr bacterial regulatory protein hth signature [Lucifera butyrica]|uniref:Tetr bacterial regulatory protein hth signature n=1 Tax=Lucifera butyrica TaxID=1351585 RepID=A0A498RDF5_9FIRM|nr:TetR/AcrR family transcriptional regulator [Lucifera butyrica]VBB09349.1 tetr bacterial regulatory protein hth signature [Lucifera butyrica]